MKRVQWLVLGLLLILSAVVATPAAAHPARTTCADVLTDTTIPGDLIVPAGVYCELEDVTVMGDVRVDQRSTLAVYRSRIEGSLSAARFELVTLHGASVGGRIRLNGGVSAWLEQATVAGDARLIDNLDTRVLQTHISGDLVVRDARGQVQFCGTTVERNARFAGNAGWVQVGGDITTCAANAVGGHLRVHHNRQAVTVANNAVGQNLVCAANEPAPTVYANQVAGKARGQCGAGEAVDGRELDDTE